MANQIEIQLNPSFSESEWGIENLTGGCQTIYVSKQKPTMRSDWNGKSFRAMPYYLRNLQGEPILPALLYFDFICDEHSVKLTAVYKSNHAPNPDPVNWPIVWDLQEPPRVNHFNFKDLSPFNRTLKIDVTTNFISKTEKKLIINTVGVN